jgi:hypothetical protein
MGLDTIRIVPVANREAPASDMVVRRDRVGSLLSAPTCAIHPNQPADRCQDCDRIETEVRRG